MNLPTITDLSVARAHGTGPADAAVDALVGALRGSLGQKRAAAVLYFASAGYEPADLAGPLSARFPDAAVIGCSTAGEFTDEVSGTGGISAVALPQGLITRAVAALGDLSSDPVVGTDAAIRQIEGALGRPLRDLDPASHLGIVLIDGLHEAEELVNERLGNAAAMLDVVGGSAGDDLAFRRTWVTVGDEVSDAGVALLVCATGVPFRIVKTCSFSPSSLPPLRITRADVGSRTVQEFDGRPAAQVYAEAIGVDVEALDASVWRQHPVGLMIDGQPWIRSPKLVTPEGGVRFYAQILEGMEVHLMDSGDLVGETASAVAVARGELGGDVSGAIWFNCVLRRLELEADNLTAPFLSALGGIPAAGFHTYGETWLGHVNQTLTGVIFG